MKSASLASMFAGAVMSACLILPAAAQDAKKQDSHLKAAMEVVEQTNTLPPFDAQLALITKNSKVWLIRENPNAEKDIVATVDAISAKYKDEREQMVKAVALAWASYFKEDELKELLAFFKTDLGQKLANYQPRIIGESIGKVQAFSKGLTARIVQESIKELNKKGHKFK